ncbi:Gfo/Idh/MocA family protein [Candidatus Entotheonella palauensis]|uniref:Gfo/Idh/MocA family protein n=1 Tax=Candidatus Entotheonella palauensis TaxID=93172 RepID=UPI0015C48DBD|nr:Gfo/Idh/MocA family oxidoreductase [Candidatus Entotheonella palauensis]
MSTFRWAIFGTGMVSRKFLLGLRSSAFDTRVTTVASRTREHAERFARDFNVPHVSEHYEAACTSPQVDAVYIATPPVVHAEHALMAIAAGKPVLLEKPFAMDAAAAERIVEAARAAGVFCMEAMWARFMPLTRHVKQMVESGVVGELRALTGSFSIATPPQAWTSMFSRALGGGALMYRGVYPLSWACHLMGPVIDAHTVSTFGETGVDEDTAVTCHHEHGISTLQASLRTHAVNDCRIMGTAGVIHVESPIYSPFRLRYFAVQPTGALGPGNPRKESLKESGFIQGLQQRARGPINFLRGRRGKTITKHFAGNGYHYEADELIGAVRAGRTESDIMPLADSLMVMAALDKARAAWR